MCHQQSVDELINIKVSQLAGQKFMTLLTQIHYIVLLELYCII